MPNISYYYCHCAELHQNCSFCARHSLNKDLCVWQASGQHCGQYMLRTLLVLSYCVTDTLADVSSRLNGSVIKDPAVRLEFNLKDLHGGHRELAPSQCPLLFTTEHICVCTHIHTYPCIQAQNNSKNNWKYKKPINIPFSKEYT